MEKMSLPLFFLNIFILTLHRSFLAEAHKWVGAAVLSRSEAATIRGESYMRKAFTSLVFDSFELGTFESFVREHAQGRCLRV